MKKLLNVAVWSLLVTVGLAASIPLGLLVWHTHKKLQKDKEETPKVLVQEKPVEPPTKTDELYPSKEQAAFLYRYVGWQWLVIDTIQRCTTLAPASQYAKDKEHCKRIVPQLERDEKQINVEMKQLWPEGMPKGGKQK